jgi:hypothetical protein
VTTHHWYESVIMSGKVGGGWGVGGWDFHCDGCEGVRGRGGGDVANTRPNSTSYEICLSNQHKTADNMS